MLTSYMVRCPYPGCNWNGSLLPKGNAEAWRPAQPVRPRVVFHCPRCNGKWHAQVVGDEVESFELEAAALPWA